MRMRKKKHLAERLEACRNVMISEPTTYKGNWQTAFAKAQPIHLEIGCGKGRFVLGMAQKHPEINFIAIEKEEGALIMATERAMKEAPANVRFLSYDAILLGDVFEQGEVDRIYLNFSDPWPPNRQRKRRLTWRAFLEVYDAILKEEGELCFKTDNQRLFEWSLGEICQFGWLVQNINLDLHANPIEDDVMTEYEERFSAQGSRIYRLEARRRLPQFLKK